MNNDILIRRREGNVLVLTMNNPSQRNALGLELFAALTQALQDAGMDAGIGAVVLCGAGGFFSAGGNLNQLQANRAATPQTRMERLEQLNAMVGALRDAPKPVIAAVEGGAAGAGMSLALACDLLVSSRTAVYSVAYEKAGLSPDGGLTHFLAEFVSRQVLTELCLTGDRLPAERLHTLGALNQLVDAGQAEAAAIALGARLAAGPARAMARIKALCRVAHETGLHDQLTLEAQRMVDSQGDDESGEGIAAFLEKRPTDFSRLR